MLEVLVLSDPRTDLRAVTLPAITPDWSIPGTLFSS